MHGIAKRLIRIIGFVRLIWRRSFVPYSEKKVNELRERLVTCESEEEALQIAQELRAAIREHIEETRRKITASRVPQLFKRIDFSNPLTD
jgi:dsDNA-specific endonuclease/ATPase MutS2